MKCVKWPRKRKWIDPGK